MCYSKEQAKEYRENNKEQAKEYRENNKEQIKEYRENNKEQIKEQKKEYYKNNKEQIKEQGKEYYKNNIEQISENSKEYYKNNKEQIKENSKEYYKNNKEQKKEYQKNKYVADIQFRLAVILRGRLGKALKNNYKCGSAVRDLGCSILELKLKLEQQFHANSKTGEMMSWENYGKWHIDHIKPLSSFDLTDRAQLLQACHYTNLQPLWAEENLSKGCKIIENKI